MGLFLFDGHGTVCAMTKGTNNVMTVHLEALESDRSSRAAGVAPVHITMEYGEAQKEEVVDGPDNVLEALDRFVEMSIMVSALKISASVSCDAKAGVTTCRILQSIASALNVKPTEEVLRTKGRGVGNGG